jgi:hypothetical protein
VLEGAGVGGDPGGVHAGLVGEGVAADVGAVGVRRHVAELVEVVRGRGQAGQLLLTDHIEAHLQLQGRQDRGEVGVAAALAIAVDAALHEPGPGLDSRQRVGHGALGVVVGVDAELDSAAQLGGNSRGRLGDEGGKAAAVGIAEGDVLGARLGGGAHAFERVGRIVAIAVEEMLGVIHRPLALGAQEGDRVGDHRQVLLAGDLDHLVDVQAPALANQADDRREALGEDAQCGVILGGEVATAGHPEGGDRRLLQLEAGQQLEELRLLGV